MITQIEMDVAHSQIRANQELVKKLTSIDWEQRRYEVAKELFPIYLQNANAKEASISLEEMEERILFNVLRMTDKFIEKLKNNKQKST